MMNGTFSCKKIVKPFLICELIEFLFLIINDSINNSRESTSLIHHKNWYRKYTAKFGFFEFGIYIINSIVTKTLDGNDTCAFPSEDT